MSPAQHLYNDRYVNLSYTRGFRLVLNNLVPRACDPTKELVTSKYVIFVVETQPATQKFFAYLISYCHILSLYLTQPLSNNSHLLNYIIIFTSYPCIMKKYILPRLFQISRIYSLKFQAR